MNKRSYRLIAIILSIVMVLSLVPASNVYAESEYIEGFVMDAETLPDGTIGILFIRGGTSSSGVVSGGTLWYGIYNPSSQEWTEEAVGASETGAMEAALAIYNGKAHIAYTTTDTNSKIGYIYQTGSGWSDVSFVESNNDGGESGALSSPDIVIGENDVPNIAYIDTRGCYVDDGTYPDAMYATRNNEGNWIKTVKYNGNGWFISPDGERHQIEGSIKIVRSNNDYVLVVRDKDWSKWQGGSDTSYGIQFLHVNGNDKHFSDEGKSFR